MSNLDEKPVECNKPGCNCQIVKALKKIVSDNEDDFVIFNALKTCRNILQNICSKPQEEKFKTLNTKNEKLNSLDIKPFGSVSLLKAAGFEKKDDQLIMSSVDLTILKKIIGLIEAFIYREYGDVNEKSNSKELKEARLKVASEKKKKRRKETFRKGRKRQNFKTV